MPKNAKFRNKKPLIFEMILRSYARNVSTEARRKAIIENFRKLSECPFKRKKGFVVDIWPENRRKSAKYDSIPLISGNLPPPKSTGAPRTAGF